MSDFDVFIAKNGGTYRYLINNANFESFIKVIKVDAETGNTIPMRARASRSSVGWLQGGNDLYLSEVTAIDTFYTNDAEACSSRRKAGVRQGLLPQGGFPHLTAMCSSHEAVKFDVTEEEFHRGESGVTVVAVKLGNYAQKGIIKISKTGEVFASVAAADGVYQPVYAVQGLAGATYEIKATEDIYTRTVRCAAAPTNWWIR